MTSRADVYAAFDSERNYQDMRKRRDQGQDFHSVEDFILFTEHYLELARTTASTTWGPDAKPKTLDVLRKVGALVVACMEQHGAPQREGFPVKSRQTFEDGYNLCRENMIAAIDEFSRSSDKRFYTLGDIPFRHMTPETIKVFRDFVESFNYLPSTDTAAATNRKR